MHCFVRSVVAVSGNFGRPKEAADAVKQFFDDYENNASDPDAATQHAMVVSFLVLSQFFVSEPDLDHQAKEIERQSIEKAQSDGFNASKFDFGLNLGTTLGLASINFFRQNL